MQIKLLFFLLLLCNSIVFAQQQEKIISNKLDINDNNDYSTFAILDSVIKEYKIFFTGENHLHRKSNYMLQLKMLKYLHQKAGVRHLFLEFGFSRGYLVNQYVQTGDSTLFTILSDYSYDEYALLYKGIWEYNKTLDSNKRIIVTGIDLERSYNTSVKVLDMFLPQQLPPAEIEIHIEALKSLAKMSDKKMQETKNDTDNEKKFKGEVFSQIRTMDYIMQSIDSLSDVWKNYLGDNFDNFNRVLKGIKAEKQRTEYSYKNTPHHYIFREQYMYEQMLQLVEKYPDDKFYGQFGRCHTPVNEQEYWCGYYYVKTLASRLNHSTNRKVNGKVLSIATYYPEGSTHEKKITEEEKLKYLLDNISADTLTIIQITSDTTLFGKLLNKYQYLIINKYKLTEDFISKDDAKDKGLETLYKPDAYLDVRAGLFFTQQNDINNNLNNFFPGNNFNMQLYSWGIMMGWLENRIANINLCYDNYMAQSIYPNDSVNFKFTGNKFMLRFGPEVTRTKAINISPLFGLGYARYTFIQNAKVQNPSPESIFISNTRVESKYNNPAFVIDGSLEIRMNFSPFTLALHGGYTYDISKKTWRYRGNNINSEAKSSHSGPYVNFCVGFLFAGE